jgi:hypothetical protein
MAGPGEQVVLDTALVGALTERLHELRGLLARWARTVGTLLAPLGWPADPSGALRTGASWADTSALQLTRRLALVRAADVDLGAAMVGGGEAWPGNVGGAARFAVAMPSGPFAGGAGAARAAGIRLGLELVGAALAPGPDGATLTRVAATLLPAAHDPDLAAGVLDAIGPARLAAVLHRAEHVDGGGFTVHPEAGGFLVGPARGGERYRADAPGHWLPSAVAEPLMTALGAALAVFSQSGRMTAAWLGRFNARGEPDAAETTLLGPLLPHGRFAPRTLRLLGDALFATTDARGGRLRLHSGPLAAAEGPSGGAPAVRDVGLYSNGARADRRAGYANALLRAIGDEPALATPFATDHVEAILAGSRTSALPPPAGRGVPAAWASAWEHLVSRAGGAVARQHDPAGAATFLARLGFVLDRYQSTHTDRARRSDTSWPLPAGMRAVIGELLHVWRAQLYQSVTGLFPSADALRDSTGDGLVPAWPGGAREARPGRVGVPGVGVPEIGASGLGASDAGSDPWSTHLPGPADGARIPARLWAALLGEALAAGGPPARALAADVAEQAAEWEQAGWRATRGYRADGHVAYPASPRALVHLQQAAMVFFFLSTLANAAAGLTLRVELGAADDARRTARVIDQLAATARSLKVSDPFGTLYGVVLGTTVSGIVDTTRPAGRPGPAALAAVTEVAAVGAMLPGWQDAYRASAMAVWLRRADDPIVPVEITDETGARRTFTGDPRIDGFITGPADDFLDVSGRPVPPERLSPAARSAYLRWLASPAIVANNDAIPTLFPPRGDLAVPE